MIYTKWLKGADDLSEAYKIRIKVFVDEQGVDKEVEIDETDKFAQHVVIYEDNTPIATGRMFVRDNKLIIGRIAVLKEYRGKKIGDFLLRTMCFKAFNQGADKVYLHSQVRAQGFYKKLGFESYGDTFDEDGIKHIRMILDREGWEKAIHSKCGGKK